MTAALDRTTRAAPRRRLPSSVWLVTSVWVASATADMFFMLTLLWAAGPQGWSGVDTAFLVVAMRAPTLLGGFLGGPAVDRLGARAVILGDVGCRALLMAGLAVTTVDGSLNLLALWLIGPVAGMLTPLTYAASRSLTPRLVDAAHVPAANAALSIGDHLPLLAGAVLVGPALHLLDVGSAMLVPAVLLAAAFAAATTLPRRPAAHPLQQSRRAPPSQRSGWCSRRVSVLLALSVVYYLAYGPFEVVLPQLVREQLRGGETMYSLLWALFAIGAAAALPLATRLARSRAGAVNAIGAALWGLVMLPVAFTGNPVLAAGLFLIGGAVWGPYAAVEATALQRWTDPRQHGRVFGAQRAMLSTAAPVGAAVGAVLTDYVPAEAVVAISALACTTAGLVALASRDLRHAA